MSVRLRCACREGAAGQRRRIIRGGGQGRGKRAAHFEVAFDRRQRRELRRLERTVVLNLRPPAAAHTSIAAPTPTRRLRARHGTPTHGPLKLRECGSERARAVRTDVLRLLMLTRRGGVPPVTREVPIQSTSVTDVTHRMKEQHGGTQYTVCGTGECY